jgi:hypothetical protein
MRLDLRIRWGPWKSPALILASLAVLLLAVAAGYAPRSSPASAQPAPATYYPNLTGRHYYLTNFSVTGNQATTACSSGYHLASLWEIYDPSNMKYDTSHPDAYTKADSGSGPPSSWYGWVRSGYDSSTSTIPGTGNCSAWTGTTGSGTIARLNSNWLTSQGAVDPWEPDFWSCTGTVPAWCIGEFSISYLPLVRR